VGLRRRARELALQLLYQFELTGEPVAEIQARFEDWNSAAKPARRFAGELVDGALSHMEEIDAALGRQTANWRLERLAAVDRNILRLAIYELLYVTDTPPPVVLDEAIEIAKKYGAEESARFVNGVLDGFLKSRVEGP